jgi:uridine kinase
MKPHSALLIGIGGVSRSGKTSLASTLASKIRSAKKKVLVIDQDDHVRPKPEIPKIKNLVDWEHPSSIDWLGLIKLIKQEIHRNDVIIIEGIFAFWSKEIKYDLKVYLQISRTLFKERKNTDKRWGDIPEWYIDHIWESHLKYGVPDHCDVGLKENDQATEVIVDYLKHNNLM